MNPIYIRLPFYQGSFPYSVTENILPDTSKDMVIPLDPVRKDGSVSQVFYSRAEYLTDPLELPDPIENSTLLNSFISVLPAHLVIQQSGGAGVSVNTPLRVNISYYIIAKDATHITSTYDVRKGWYTLGAPVPNLKHVIDVEVPDGARIVGVKLTFDVVDDMHTIIGKPYVFKGFEFLVPDNSTILSLFDTDNPVGQ